MKTLILGDEHRLLIEYIYCGAMNFDKSINPSLQNVIN